MSCHLSLPPAGVGGGDVCEVLNGTIGRNVAAAWTEMAVDAAAAAGPAAVLRAGEGEPRAKAA